MYLLDTNVISETRRPARMNRNVKAWLEQTGPESLYTSVIVMMELERGVLGMERKDPAQGAVLREWLEEVVKPAFKVPQNGETEKSKTYTNWKTRIEYHITTAKPDKKHYCTHGRAAITALTNRPSTCNTPKTAGGF